MDTNPRFMRMRARSMLVLLASELSHSVTVDPARTVELARDDADLLDELAELAFVRAVRGDALDVVTLAGQPNALQGWMPLG